MKYANYLILLFLLVGLSGCGEKKTQTQETTESTTGMVVKDKKRKRSTVVNNMLVGHSKISFNNEKYDILSEGKFTQETLWGTFQQENNQKTYIQIDAFDNTQKMYGDIEGYVLDGVQWDEAEPVQYLGVMEEALQPSKDKKVLMYKARTGDVIFSVTMFGKEKLTNKDILNLKEIAKSIKVEYVADQMISAGGE
ncbi:MULTISPECIES: hypothetical protein [Vagococcus]|uniref:hypothetical protein n=1 Tax=Vagococcus TaxID=2737 RepID=UPI000E53C85B|nr:MULTISPECIES: hypothetical protein [Vagococcus]RHH71449.1 hypothetical protein DW196_02655 [Vagococcus sp. AM17-17]